MKGVAFKAVPDDDTEDGYYYEVSVDGETVCSVMCNQLDIADYALDPLWEKLGIDLSFDHEETDKQ